MENQYNAREIGFDYKIIPLKLSDGDQFKAALKKISPFNKIPESLIKKIINQYSNLE